MKNFWDIPSLKAATSPLEPALSFVEDDSGALLTISWGELPKWIGGAARAIADTGAQSGDAVLIISEHPSRQIMFFLGALSLHCYPVISSFPSSKQPHEAFITMLTSLVEKLPPKTILVDRQLQAAVKSAIPQHITCSFPEQIPIASAWEFPKERLAGPAFRQLSSGTTAARKSVEITWEMLTAQAESYGRRLKFVPSDRVISWMPLYHDGGLVACFLIPFYHGIHSIHMSPFRWLMDPIRLLDLISTVGGTLVTQPNFAYELLAKRAPKVPNFRLGGVRAFINGAEPVRHMSHLAFLKAYECCGVRIDQLQVLYGMAETTISISQTDLSRPARVERVVRSDFLSSQIATRASEELPEQEVLYFVSCGTPIEGMQIRIAGTAQERVVGEIEVRGVGLFSGYTYVSDRKPDHFSPDGWFRTGDLGFIVDGELFVCGRKKDLVIVHGVNIYPEEVEFVLRDVAGCKPGRIVVFGVPDEVGGSESLIVMAERDSDRQPDEVIRQGVSEEVFGYFNVQPTDIYLMEADSLLKSTSGKFSRTRNRDLYLSLTRPKQDAAKTPAATGASVEVQAAMEALKLLWQSELPRKPEQIDCLASVFSTYGADSLAVASVATRVLTVFGRAIDQDWFYSRPTVLQQAEALIAMPAQAGEGAGLPDDAVFHDIATSTDPTARELAIFLPGAGGRPGFASQLLASLGREDVSGLEIGFPLRSGGVALDLSTACERLAERLVAAKPFDSYVVGGPSFGAVTAFELARRLELRGNHVRLVWMVDPPLFGPRSKFLDVFMWIVSHFLIPVGFRPKWFSSLTPFKRLLLLLWKLDEIPSGVVLFRALKRADPKWNMNPDQLRILTTVELWRHYLGYWIERGDQADKDLLTSLGIRVEDHQKQARYLLDIFWYFKMSTKQLAGGYFPGGAIHAPILCINDRENQAAIAFWQKHTDGGVESHSVTFSGRQGLQAPAHNFLADHDNFAQYNEVLLRAVFPQSPKNG